MGWDRMRREGGSDEMKVTSMNFLLFFSGLIQLLDIKLK